MTKTAFPLLALVLSTTLHAGNEFIDPFDCRFDLFSRHRRIQQEMLRPRSKPLSVPVSLLRPTGDKRFGTGMVVQLINGDKVTAFSNASSATPEMIWQHLQQKYRGQTLRPLWWGEVEIQKQEDEGSPGRIVRARALPVQLSPFSRPNPHTENNVEHLVEALTAIGPGLVDPTEVRKSPVSRAKSVPLIQLAPFITSRRAVNDVLVPIQGILQSCLRDRNEYPTTARQFLDAFSTNMKTFAAHQKNFSSVLLGLENDGLIATDKRRDLELLFAEMLSTDHQPNRYLGEALHGELSALQERIRYVVANPNDHVEIIEPGTILQTTGSESPAGQQVDQPARTTLAP